MQKLAQNTFYVILVPNGIVVLRVFGGEAMYSKYDREDFSDWQTVGGQIPVGGPKEPEQEE